jgi:hypothetical protein
MFGATINSRGSHERIYLFTKKKQYVFQQLLHRMLYGVYEIEIFLI